MLRARDAIVTATLTWTLASCPAPPATTYTDPAPTPAPPSSALTATPAVVPAVTPAVAPVAPDVAVAPEAAVAPYPCRVPGAPAGASLAERLDLVSAQCGVLLVTRDDGLHALTADLQPVATITPTRVRWVQARREGETRALYYFAADAPHLIEHDLRTGTTKVLVKLPRVGNRCFLGLEADEKAPPADPVQFIQSSAGIDLDLAAGVLCLDISDRNENMAEYQINYRADLRTGKTEQRNFMVSDDCKQPGVREQARACQTMARDEPKSTEIAALGGEYGLVSPSGQWMFYRDETFTQMADHIYMAAFLYDTRAKTTHAITPTGLVKQDRAARDARKGPPEGTCLLPGEASPRWMPGRDVLIVDGCGLAGTLVVAPPGRVHELAGHQVAVYP